MSNQPFAESYPEIEAAVLGACLLERSAMQRIIGNTVPEDFSDPKNRLIFNTLTELFSTNHPIDTLVVARKLAHIEGIAYYLTTLTSNLASSANLEYHQIILVQASIKRGLRSLGSQLTADGLSDPLEWLDTTDREITRLNARVRGGTSVTTKALMPAFAEALVKRKSDAEKGITPGLQTGIYETDRHWGGFFPGDVVVFAGRPGMGKTAVALAFGLSLAKNRIPVGLISLEMNTQSLLERLVSPDSGVPYSKIRRGEIDDLDLQRIGKATEIIQSLPITIDQSPDTELLGIKARLKTMADQGVKVVFIDYIQLISCKGLKTRYEIVSEVSRQLKQMALNLNICIVPLAQLNREVDKQEFKRPILSNLKESGQIEQDADGVIFLWRPEHYGMEEFDGQPTRNSLYLIVEKYRNGDAGYDIILPCDIGLNRIGYGQSVRSFGPEPKQTALPHWTETGELPGKLDDDVPF